MRHPITNFPKRQWWVGAYSTEVERKIFARTILNNRVAFFRTEDGKAQAVNAFCPHRNFPFEKSTLVGDKIRCGYHGFEYDCAGTCTDMPTQNKNNIPTNQVLQTYPLVEKGGVIWIWTGEPELADESSVPDIESLGAGAESWKSVHGDPFHIKARYTLMIDNLLDLTHVSFIHLDTIPGAENVAKTKGVVSQDGDRLLVTRSGKNIPHNPYYALLFPDYSGSVDQHFDTNYIAPSLIQTGGPLIASETQELLGVTNYLHFLTPETEHSCTYFTMSTRSMQPDSPTLDAIFNKQNTEIGPQDKEAVENIEQSFINFPELAREISCTEDFGSLRVRKILARQIESESE